MESEQSVKPLKALCAKIGSGATPKGGSSVYLERGEVCLIRSQNVLHNSFSTTGLVYIDSAAAEDLRNVVVEKDDVLLNITGDSVARCCQVTSQVLPARVNQHVVIIRPNPADLNPRFLKYFLVSPHTQRHLLTLASAGATRNALTKGMIEELEIPTFPIKVQSSIAHILGTLDDKIELNRRMNETLESMARALFKSWFVDFDPVIDNALAAGNAIPEPLAARAAIRRALGPKRKTLPENIQKIFPATFTFNEEMGWIPEGWESLPYGCLLEFENGDRGKNYPNVSQFVETGIPFINAGHLLDGAVDLARVSRISEETFTKLRSGKVRPGDLLYCLRGSPGRVARVGRMKRGAIASSLVIVRPSERACASYVYHTLSSSVGQQMAAELNNGSAQPNVSVTSLSTYPVLAPTVACQRAFASMAEPLLERVEDRRTESLILVAVRDTLLPKLLSGELRIPEAERLVAGSV